MAIRAVSIAHTQREILLHLNSFQVIDTECFPIQTLFFRNTDGNSFAVLAEAQVFALQRDAEAHISRFGKDRS